MISFESVSVFFLAPGKEGDLSVLAAALIEGDSEVLENTETLSKDIIH